MDRFPAEQQRILRVLEQDVERLKVVAKTVAPVPIRKAAAISALPNMTAPQSGSNPVVADQYNRLRSDTAVIHEWVKELHASLRAAGLIE